MNIFEYMWGLVLMVALIDFAANPKKAMNDAYCTFLTPGPRITADGSRMYFPKSLCATQEASRKRPNRRKHTGG